jgi:formylglycine-generating enzyme required for sulfatase activity
MSRVVKATAIRRPTFAMAALGLSVLVAGCVPAFREGDDLEPGPVTAPGPAVDPEGDRQVGGDGMVLVFVPDGPFLMGSRDDDPQSSLAERPQREIHLDGYWIDQTEVTNAMYAVFLNDMGNQREAGVRWLTPSKARVHRPLLGAWRISPGFERHPVSGVTWFGARAYCEWSGRRLPTEAEWEKAARGTDGRTYPWGEGVLCDMAHVEPCVSARGTAPVGSYPSDASPYGALDMAGNVAEWVADWYLDDIYAEMPDRNPRNEVGSAVKVVRGGSWSDDARAARAAARGSAVVGATSTAVGFRCALSPSD